MRIVNDTEIVEDYNNGMKWEDLLTKHNCSVTTIHDVLRRNNISKTRIEAIRWTSEKKELFKKMYLANCTYPELCNAFNLKSSTVTGWVHKLGLPMRGSGRNNKFENKFSNNTPESFYWLGYLFADGHFDTNERHKNIQLYSGKKYVIEKFCEWFGQGVKVYSKTYTTKSGEKKTIYCAKIHDSNIVDWFIDELDITSDKRYTLNPKIELNWDIVRGFFDGDGTASNYWKLTSGSEIWLERIQQFLSDNGIKSTFREHDGRKYFTLHVFNSQNISLLVSLMYANSYYCHEYKYKLLLNHIPATV